MSTESKNNEIIHFSLWQNLNNSQTSQRHNKKDKYQDSLVWRPLKSQRQIIYKARDTNNWVVVAIKKRIEIAGGWILIWNKKPTQKATKWSEKLKAYTALVKEPSSVPSVHVRQFITASNFSSRVCDILLYLQFTTAYRDTWTCTETKTMKQKGQPRVESQCSNCLKEEEAGEEL